MLKKIRTKAGSATIEGVISFTAFLFAFFVILGVVNVCRAQMLISNAVDTTAKEIAEYSYFYKMSGLKKVSDAVQGNAKISKENLNDVVGTVDNLYNKVTTSVNDDIETLTNVANATTSGNIEYSDMESNIENIIKQINNQGVEIDTAVTQVENALSTVKDNPMGYMRCLIAVAGNETLEIAKSRVIAAPLAKCFIVKHFGKNSNEADIFLENLGVVDGLDGLNFKMSTIFATDSPEDVVITVYYKVRVMPIIKWWNLEASFGKTAKARAWLAGDDAEASVIEKPSESTEETDASKPKEESTSDEEKEPASQEPTSSEEPTTKAEDLSIDDIKKQVIDKYGDEVKQWIEKYGDDVAIAIYKCNDDAVRLMEKHKGYIPDIAKSIVLCDKTAVKAIDKCGYRASHCINSCGEDAATVIISYGYDAVNAIQKCQDDGETGKDAIDFIKEYGEPAAKLQAEFGYDASLDILEYGQEVIDIYKKYGLSGYKAFKNGISPDTIEKLAKEGFKPDDFEKYKITNQKIAEKVYKSVTNKEKNGDGSVYTWQTFYDKNGYTSPDVATDDYNDLVKNSSPWPKGYTPKDTTLKKGDTVYIAVYGGETDGNAYRPKTKEIIFLGDFASKEEITDMNYLRQNLAVKESWKSSSRSIYVLELKITEDVNVKSGPIGPQIDVNKSQKLDAYLSGSKSGTQYQFPKRNLKDVSKLVKAKKIN